MTMDRDIRNILWAFLGGLALVALILLAFGRSAKSQPADLGTCPPGAKSCKILTITPEEEQTLAGPDMVWDQALWARQQFGPLLKAWRDKFQNAPQGKPYVEPTPPK